MSGYRMRRKTRGANYIAANSSLTLPWAYSNSVDDGTHGVFPEFFYSLFQNPANPCRGWRWGKPPAAGRVFFSGL